MKHTVRTAVLLLALVICAQAIALGEGSTAPATELPDGVYESLALSALDVDFADLLASPEGRAVFCALMTLEMFEPEAIGMADIISEYGLPDMYVTRLHAYSDDDVTMTMHFTDGDFALFVTYVTSQKLFAVSRVESDYARYSSRDCMEQYILSGVIDRYDQVSLADYAGAVGELQTMFNQ